MSLGAWGDDGDADRPYTQERLDEIVADALAEQKEALTDCLHACEEALEFVEDYIVETPPNRAMLVAIILRAAIAKATA